MTIKQRLRLEFALFYLVSPALIALFLPPTQMFPALFAFTGLGLLLLALTPRFHWSRLLDGARSWQLREFLAFTFFCLTSFTALIYLLRPESAFLLVRERPELLGMIWLFYPLVSALPQELLFRVLFFRRYRAILPRGAQANLLNAAVFSLAHLMYWSWVVALITFAGSFVFSHAYRVRGSFFYTVLLHAIAGNLLFTVGMGAYFYSGNVVRPF
ncbi:CPBP family intramembrane metalloprotease [Epibacterium sp. SM1979]|uniref:CPBP family intramembrane metalloprotease n=1 Tax=Tritonibacter litoralis TaxID=2662264 RepID=A0A843YFR6_9RHOB|nr:CPBP family intramembrane glutamic endopeptidase [Tritonibacter litoralis]MQQ07949.1 CPBP family intramembrane metalloprotease [Tritonibacter litoralis]